MENTNEKMSLEKARDTLDQICNMIFDLPLGGPEWNCQMANKRYLENYILQNFDVEGFLAIVPQ
jgi:hypothetical protein